MTNPMRVDVCRFVLSFGAFIALIAGVGPRNVVTTAQQVEPAKPAPAEWTRYTVASEEFSVELPLKPAMISIEFRLRKLDTTRMERTLGAYEDGVGYVIYAFENPRHRESFEDLIAEFKSKVSAGEFQREVQTDGMKGREYGFAKDDLKSLTQFYFARDHFYIFRVVGSSLREPDSRMSKFIASIRFEKQRLAEKVEDGVGDLPQATQPDGATEVILNPRSVDRKVFVLTRPEPRYTEEARMNQVVGSVVLKGVLRSSGVITNVVVTSKLPNGLTEKALAIVKQLKFIPAVKDGHLVSTYAQLEYNFNLY